MKVDFSIHYNLILSESWDSLKNQGIRFCILSGHEDWPEYKRSEDIDIVVSKNDVGKAAATFKAVFKKHGSTCYAVHKVKGKYTYFFYFPDNNGLITDSLKIDLFVNFEFRGRVFLEAKEILENMQPFHNINVPSEAQKVYMSIVKGILKGGSSWEKYLPRIQKGFPGHEKEVISLLSRAFRRDTVNFIIMNLTNGHIDEIEKIRHKLILETYKRFFTQAPIRFPMSVLLHCAAAASNLLNPPKYMIAILGPDGVGKTTLVNHIQKRLMDILKIDAEGMKVFHIRPGIFPTVSEMLRRKGHGDEKTSFLREFWQSPSRVISFVRLFGFWFDYVLGYLIKILPELGKYNVVILDRYYYDILVDPARYNINLSYGFMRTVFKLLPRPVVAIVLDAPPEIIFDRKKELDVDRIETLLIRYRRLRDEFDNFHVLPATCTPDDLSREVVSTFLNRAAWKLT